MDEPTKRTVSIRLPIDLYDQADAAAKTEYRSFNNWVNRVIEHAITQPKIDRVMTGPPIVSENRFETTVSREVAEEVLGVPADVLEAQADHMEQSLGVRPDTVRRGDKEAPLPRGLRWSTGIPVVRQAKTEATPIPKKGKK